MHSEPGPSHHSHSASHSEPAAWCGCNNTGSWQNETAVPLGAGSQLKQPSILWQQCCPPKQLWKWTETHPTSVLEGFPPPTSFCYRANQILDKQLAKIVYMFKWVSSGITAQSYGTGTLVGSCSIPRHYLPKGRYGDASTNRSFSLSKEPQTALDNKKQCQWRPGQDSQIQTAWTWTDGAVNDCFQVNFRWMDGKMGTCDGTRLAIPSLELLPRLLHARCYFIATLIHCSRASY